MTQEEILNEIKSVITTHHPYMENRLPILLKYPNPSMDIKFYFHPTGTVITFLDGLETKKSSIPKKIELDFVVEPALINSLVAMLLQDHDYISDIKRSSNALQVGTDVELTLDNYAGIACGAINVELDFYGYPNSEELLNSYYDALVCAFYDQIKDTPSFKYEFVNDGEKVKKDTINNLTKEDILNILGNLSDEELHSILNALPLSVFMQAYQSSNAKLIRKDPNT